MMLPIIAIVGYADVGKSTLFNCLTDTRAALVAKGPGTTRDRQFGIVHQYGHHFIVVDTAGIIHHTTSLAHAQSLEQLMMQQTKLAIAEADAILFVVDGRAISTQDRIIAHELRAQNKLVILVVNKTEQLPPARWVEAYELGIKSLVAISASQRQGIDRLIATLFSAGGDIVAHHAVSPILPNTPAAMKLAIIGCPNSGKSTLINSLVGQERVVVHPEAGTTRDSIIVPFVKYGQEYRLIDTAGVRRKKKITMFLEQLSVMQTLRAIQMADVVLYLIDGIKGITDQDLKMLYFALESGPGLVLVVNKWDAVDATRRKQLQCAIKGKLSSLVWIRVHYISALKQTGLPTLWPSITTTYRSSLQTPATAQLTRLLQQAVTEYPPPLVRGRRVKLRYAHLGGHHPLCIVIHGNQVESLPESYQRYVRNFYQRALQLTGILVKLIFKSGENPFG